jgi:hypothetical protein
VIAMNVAPLLACILSLALEDDARTLEIYDVHDYVAPPGSGPSAERLVEMTSFIDAFLAPAQPDAEVRALGGSIIVRALPAQHDWVRAFLRQTLGDTRILVRVSGRLVTPGPRARAAIDARPDGILVGEAADELLATLQGEEHDELQLPQTLAYPMQRTLVETKSERTYVSGYESHHDVLPDGAIVVLPLLGTVSEGLAVECTAAPLDAATIGVRFRVEQSQMETPIATQQTEHGPTCSPIVTTISVESKLVLPDGALFAFPLPDELGAGRVLLLQAERILPEH